MKTGYFEVSPGNKSMGRLIGFIVIMAGIGTVGAGIALAFLDKGVAAICITSGAGLVGSGEFLKGWQKRNEKTQAT